MLKRMAGASMTRLKRKEYYKEYYQRHRKRILAKMKKLEKEKYHKEKIEKNKHCLDCNKLISPHAKRCQFCFNKGNLHPSWKHGKSGSYIRRLARMVLEKKYGILWKEMYLPENPIIHHINENRQDNRFENLCVMTRGEHIALHNSLRNCSLNYVLNTGEGALNLNKRSSIVKGRRSFIWEF